MFKERFLSAHASADRRLPSGRRDVVENPLRSCFHAGS
jgi:hypothetical protein